MDPEDHDLGWETCGGVDALHDNLVVMIRV
jgi:hypothetical protein